MTNHPPAVGRIEPPDHRAGAPRCCHRTPRSRRALVEVGRIVAGSGLRPGPARLAGPPPRWLPERPAAGLLLAATGRPPPPPAPPPPPGWRPGRRPRSGGTTAAWATPSRHSPLLRPLSASMQSTCPTSAVLTEESGVYRPHGSQP